MRVYNGLWYSFQLGSLISSHVAYFQPRLTTCHTVTHPDKVGYMSTFIVISELQL